jgi:hypothetical protein
LHTLNYLYSVKQHIKTNDESPGKPPLQLTQLKNIQPDDASIGIAQSMHEKLN